MFVVHSYMVIHTHCSWGMMPMLSGVRTEWGVRGTVEGDIGENWEGEGVGAGEERLGMG